MHFHKAKSFGEAKRIAEEIKTRMVEGQSYQTQVETLSDELKGDKGSVETLQKQAQSLQVELAHTEKAWGESCLLFSKTVGRWNF